MRIQEHLFQGYFGLKKKKDSAKYYHERVGKLRGLDNDLDKCIEDFQTILKNHKSKINAYDEFLKKLDLASFQAVKREVNKLEGMFDQDELANDSERKYVARIEGIINNLIGDEENSEINQLQKDTLNDLKELLRMIENIKPVWEKQLEFMKRDEREILSQKENIRVLTAMFKEESDILNMEESLLRRIDLKTGNILRKTTLKLRDVEKTKEMDMSYREIKHIR